MDSRRADSDAGTPWHAAICINHDATDAHGGDGEPRGPYHLWSDSRWHIRVAETTEGDDRRDVLGFSGGTRLRYIAKQIVKDRVFRARLADYFSKEDES